MQVTVFLVQRELVELWCRGCVSRKMGSARKHRAALKRHVIGEPFARVGINTVRHYSTSSERNRYSGNGFVERFNHTLNEMLCTTTRENPPTWDQRIPLLMMAYRAMPHEFTEFSLNFMV